MSSCIAVLVLVNYDINPSDGEEGGAQLNPQKSEKHTAMKDSSGRGEQISMESIAVIRLVALVCGMDDPMTACKENRMMMLLRTIGVDAVGPI